LVVSGSRAAPAVDKATRHSLGRWSGSFRRTLKLPANADLERVGAELTDGVLTVRVPKLPEAQPRRIAVK
jgi:HSP20 family protein